MYQECSLLPTEFFSGEILCIACILVLDYNILIMVQGKIMTNTISNKKEKNLDLVEEKVKGAQ